MMTDETEKPRSFAKALFAGQIHERMVFPYPALKKEEEETLNLVLDTFRKFAKDKIDPAKIDREGKIPDEVLNGLKEMGFFGLQVPEKFGGLGLGQVAYGRVFEEIGSVDASIAATLGAHSSIGIKALLLFGTEEQKAKYLPKLASGEMVAAFALTEPGAGSDAYAIRTRAVKQPDGSYLLNGNKLWITNGAIADFVTVFAKDEDKVSAFIVTSDMNGFSTGKNEHKLGIRGSVTTELAFTNMRVPKENLLGEPGKGFKMAMEVLNAGRLGLGTGCVGGCRELIRLASAHANQRKQFGQPIADFELIQDKLGRMVIETYVAESIAYLTCGLVDAGVPDFSIESAICKISGSETLWFVVNEALQIAGGIGYMQEYPYERFLRDTRINLIFEGTNEILRLFIALSGMKNVGDHLKIVGEALNAPVKSFGVLYDYFISKPVQRSLQGEKVTLAHPELKRETAMFENDVEEFEQAIEKAIRKHRKKIFEKQFVQKRICEIAVDLYKMIAVISRVTKAIESKGAEKAQAELTIARAFCVEAHARITRNLRQMDQNIDELLKSSAGLVSEAAAYPLPLIP
jgi:acyl-CoA dehydrogenase family member 9